jgi:SAM-dependent methyltransferase
MNIVPWRVKNFISEHFPLLYHLAVNIGTRGNSPEHWDARLAATWHAANRCWPTKNALIASLTTKSDRILDIGCGNGSILRHLRGLGYTDLHGLEISRYAIQRLRAEGIEMHYGSLPLIPLPNASFDVVIASQVLEHVIRRRRFAREIRRVLRPKGRAFVFVPDNCLGPISEPEHVIKYDARSLRGFLQREFEIVELRTIQDVHPMPILFAHLTKKSGEEQVEHYRAATHAPD